MHNDLKTVEEENKILKEELTKNINIQSISTHQSADGKVGNSIKYFWSFTVSQNSPEQLKLMEICFKIKKKKSNT